MASCLWMTGRVRKHCSAAPSRPHTNANLEEISQRSHIDLHCSTRHTLPQARARKFR